MTTDLAAWLSARYDEAEALAKAAFGGTGAWWRREEQPHLNSAEFEPVGALYEGPLPEVDDSGNEIFTARVVVYDEGAPNDNEFAHIAANDPAHRLRDIALKRAILGEHGAIPASYVATVTVPGGPFTFGCLICGRNDDGSMAPVGWCATVRQLGTEFSDKPGYLESWKPEG